MSSVRVITDTFIEYPFLERGDSNTKVYHMICQQRESDYNPAQVALDTPMTSAAAAGVLELPFDADSSAYCLGDSNHSPRPGGMLQFERTFSNIPSTTFTPIGSEEYTFPALPLISGGPSYGTSHTITALNMVLGQEGIFITTSTAHGLAVGDNAHLSFTYKIGTGDEVYSVNTSAGRVISTPSTTQIQVKIGKIFNEQTTLTIVAGKIIVPSFTGSLGPRTVHSVVFEEVRYILPGVTPNIGDIVDMDFALTYETMGFSSSPDGVPYLDFNTYPTGNEYLDMVDNKALLVTRSDLTRWRGNIYKHRTRYIQAR